MGDISIELWLDQHRYDALKRIFNEAGTSVEAVMQARLMALYEKTVPEQERMNINNQMEGERLAAERWASERRRFSVFRIVEDRQSRYIECEHPFDFLNAAHQTRRYLRGEIDRKPTSFADYLLRSGSSISAEKFADLTRQCNEGSANITGLFDIDLDKGDFYTVRPNSGWAGFTIKDIITAAYHAYRKDNRAFNDRWRIFLEHLDGRQMAQSDPAIIREAQGSQRLLMGDVHFFDEIMEESGKLNFYMSTDFNVDQVFGTHVETSDNDDWINVYANYDIEKRQVYDTLDIIFDRADGTCEELTYRLDDCEKDILLEKMNAYCLEQAGLALEAYCDSLQAGNGPSLGQSTLQ
jgi:hypothetical protein